MCCFAPVDNFFKNNCVEMWGKVDYFVILPRRNLFRHQNVAIFREYGG